MKCNCNDIPVIDSHMHIRGWFHNLKELLDANARIIDKCNFQAANAASISQWDKQSLGQNLVCILFKKLNSGKAYAYGSLDYYLPSIKKTKKEFYNQVRNLMEMGFDGIKMVEGKPSTRKYIGDIPLNSPLYDDYYGFLEEEKIPVLFHNADPDEAWDPDKCPDSIKKWGWYFGGGDFVEKETLYKEVEDVLNKFPKLCIHFAHLYFLSYDLDRLTGILERWENVSFDITPGRELYYNLSNSLDKSHDFFTKYQDRILFGTDNGWGEDVEGNDVEPEQKVSKAMDNVKVIREFLETDNELISWKDYDCKNFKGIKLDCEALKKIYRDNFIRYAGENPKKVDMDYVTDYCNRLLADLSGRASDDKVYMQIKQAAELIKEIGDA